MHTINYSVDMFGEPEPIYVEFETIGESLRVQRRLARHCGRPVRISNKLELYPFHIECSRMILGKEYGFIKEKYRDQLK